MAELTAIEGDIYARQVMRLESSRARQAATVVAKARKELLRGHKGDAVGILSNLDRALASFDDELLESLETDKLIETGFRQGAEHLRTAGTGTALEGPTKGWTPVLDLSTLANLRSRAVAQISGTSAAIKKTIKEQCEISLALGEGTTETMARVIGAKRRSRRRDAPALEQLNLISERIARTVTNDLVNQGKVASYGKFQEENPQLQVFNDWHNIGDHRTSDLCLALSQHPPVPVGDMFNAGGWSGVAPPAHPFCRSTLLPVLMPVEAEQPQAAPVQPQAAPVQPQSVRPVLELADDPNLSIERVEVDGAAYGRPGETIRVNALAGVPEDVSNSRIFEARRVARDLARGRGSADTHDLLTNVEQAKAVTMMTNGEYGLQANLDLNKIYDSASREQKEKWAEEFDGNPQTYTGEAARKITEDLIRIKREKEQEREAQAEARRLERQSRQSEPAQDDFLDDLIGEPETTIDDFLDDFLGGASDNDDEGSLDGLMDDEPGVVGIGPAKVPPILDSDALPRERFLALPMAGGTMDLRADKVLINKDIPAYDVAFMHSRYLFSPIPGTPKEKMRAAMAVRKGLNQMFASLPDGAILKNSPIGGKGSGRDRIYQKAGFGEITDDSPGTQYAIIKDGKPTPIVYADLKPYFTDKPKPRNRFSDRFDQLQNVLDQALENID